MDDIDYPAAHSMDTTWYAIDAVGHVGQFNTGENGHAPERCNATLSIYELDRHLRQRSDDDWDPEDVLAEHFGLFHYDYDEDYDPISPFYRTLAPANPLHIDTLPPAFRKAWKIVTFPGLVFAESPLVQPIDFEPCVYWYDSRIAFVASDGVTVRPIVGHEHEFDHFVRDLRRENPELAAKFTFVNTPPVYKKKGRNT